MVRSVAAVGALNGGKAGLRDPPPKHDELSFRRPGGERALLPATPGRALTLGAGLLGAPPRAALLSQAARSREKLAKLWDTPTVERRHLSVALTPMPQSFASYQVSHLVFFLWTALVSSHPYDYSPVSQHLRGRTERVGAVSVLVDHGPARSVPHEPKRQTRWVRFGFLVHHSARGVTPTYFGWPQAWRPLRACVAGTHACAAAPTRGRCTRAPARTRSVGRRCTSRRG